MSIMEKELQRQLDTYLSEMRSIQSATEHHNNAEHLLTPKIVAVYGAMIVESGILLDMEWYWANDSDRIKDLYMQTQWLPLPEDNPLVCIQKYGSAVLLNNMFHIRLTHVHKSTGEEYLQLHANDPVNLVQFCNAYGIIVYGLKPILDKTAEEEKWIHNIQMELRRNLNKRSRDIPADKVLEAKQ